MLDEVVCLEVHMFAQPQKNHDLSPSTFQWLAVARTTTAVVLTVIAVAAIIARYIPISNHLLVFAAALFPYLSLASIPALALFAVAKRWIAAAFCAILLVTASAINLPLYVAADRTAESVRVRVMTANLYLGRADANAVIALATAEADLLAVQELTPSATDRLSAGLGRSFPYRVVDPRDEAGGVGLWSRFPIENSMRIPGFRMAMVSVRLNVDGVAADPTVIVAHISGPWPQPIADWRDDMHRLDITMSAIANDARTGPVIVIGDSNSTIDMRQFRRLLRSGYRDASEQAGTGPAPTYPGNSAVPPVIPIDHIITNDCVATSVSTVKLPGSDHRGLQAAIDIPRSITPHAASSNSNNRS